MPKVRAIINSIRHDKRLNENYFPFSGSYHIQLKSNNENLTSL
jgi:hypothetical protein